MDQPVGSVKRRVGLICNSKKKMDCVVNIGNTRFFL